jgi:hypothetical protein
VREIAVYEGHCHRAFADSRRAALDRAAPHIARGEHARHVRLEVIGFAIERPVGRPLQLSVSEPGPFAERADVSLVVKGIADLMAMPSAGDLVI